MDTTQPGESPNTASNFTPESSPETSDSFLAFSSLECTLIAAGFYLGAFSGTFLNGSVLLVLGHVMIRDAIKSGSDFLIAVLTSLDLLATTILFLFEGAHFGSAHCNDAPKPYLFIITFFLECSSALSLLNVALFRYSKICLVNVLDIDFKRTVYMSIANIVISLIASFLVYLCNNPDFFQLSMTVYMLTIFAVFILMGVLYFTAYWALRKRSQLSRQRNAQRKQIARGMANNTRSNTTDDKDTIPKGESSTKGADISDKGGEKGRVRIVSKKKKEEEGVQVESPAKSAIELMTERSAKVFIAITLRYLLCFIPNALLTLSLLVLGHKKFYQLQMPTILQVSHDFFISSFSFVLKKRISTIDAQTGRP